MRRQERGSGSIDAQSRDFLIDIFTSLYDDQWDLMLEGRQPPCRFPEKEIRSLMIYVDLLSGLTGLEEFPDDEGVREYVAGLVKAADEGNEGCRSLWRRWFCRRGYKRMVLEHRALKELAEALAAAEK